MRISEIGLRAAIEQLLPHCVTAGAFACRVQDDIVAHGARNGDHKSGDRFVEVVTDADIAVESYFGVLLHTLFEDASFYGEEYERDRVSAYLPKGLPYLVTLDPVDGTRYFADGLPLFSTIITITVDLVVQAAVTYVPRDGRFFYAVRGEGAWTTTAADVLAGNAPARYRFAADGNLVLLHPGLKEHKDALVAAGFDVCVHTLEYDASPHWKKANVRKFYGEITAVVLLNAQLIDAHAQSFICTEAGAVSNPQTVDPETMRTKLSVTAKDRATYEKIMAVVGERRA